MKKVSFVIPTLNAEKFLENCLTSIKNQDYPKDKIEILVVDAGSSDKTISIAKKFNCRVIKNPHVNQEPGKSIGLKASKGDVCFFLDADNSLANKNWIKLMIEPLEEKGVRGLLPQTVPPKDSSGLNRYLGYLFTDPFTWFVYGDAANPQDYKKIFRPLKKTDNYEVYKFDAKNHPLFGLAQGVGTLSSFEKSGIALYDDILAGIKLIKEGGLIAYVPDAGVYHYHVEGFKNFIEKYRWRIRNNLNQKYKGFGMTNRDKYMMRQRKIRRPFFILYSLSLIFPFLDAIELTLRYRDPVMLWHVPTCIGLALLILVEFTRFKLHMSPEVSAVYGK